MHAFAMTRDQLGTYGFAVSLLQSIYSSDLHCGIECIEGIEVHAAEGHCHSIGNVYRMLRPPTIFSGVPECDTFLTDKHDPLNRFANVIVCIAGIFELQTKSLHIFYDVPGGPIASNRGGTIYLNLRFFEEWREYNLCAD